MKSSVAIALTLLTLTVAAATVNADESYPSKPVRLIVPYAPGGGSDIIARIVGLKLGEALNQTFVVDNRPGAASLIATEIVAKAPGDGYTLILADVPHAINAAIASKPAYDAVRDFAPIMLVATTPQILVAHPSFAANSLKELLATPRDQTGVCGIYCDMSVLLPREDRGRTGCGEGARDCKM